jgi:hypothetical protein
MLAWVVCSNSYSFNIFNIHDFTFCLKCCMEKSGPILGSIVALLHSGLAMLIGYGRQP